MIPGKTFRRTIHASMRTTQGTEPRTTSAVVAHGSMPWTTKRLSPTGGVSSPVWIRTTRMMPTRECQRDFVGASGSSGQPSMAAAISSTIWGARPM